MKRILIIEDNEHSLYLIAFILEKYGYEVIQARDGEEGIDRAVENKPALILLDIQWPEIDGYMVAEKLKTNPETRDTPLLQLRPMLWWETRNGY